MKARVKATIWYKTPQGACFTKDELEFIDTENNFDYWTRLEHQYAGMAMQGMLSCKDLFMELGNIKGMSTEDALAKAASTIAHALVEKMKEERK